jgi:drug/metabolite transporter (DMT)-like permease
MTAVVLGLLAALTNGAQAVMNKGFTDRYPARNLIGVLYLLNFAVLLPLAPLAAWRWSPTIVALHLVSVALMSVTAICIWDLFDKGAASATTTAGALSPIPTAIATAVLVPGVISAWQVVASLVVMGGVLWALDGAFGSLGRRGTWLRILGAAIGNGLLTVASRLLGDEGVGVVETYLVRTGIAAVIFMVAIPPRGIPIRATPRLMVRSVLVTASFVCIIIGAQQGSPLVVQTLVSTTPLFVLAWESWSAGAWPSRRGLAASLAAALGVGLVLIG